VDELAKHRKAKDDFFARDPDSPLTPYENHVKAPVRIGEKLFHE
jgi:hypothetical protein